MFYCYVLWLEWLFHHLPYTNEMYVGKLVMVLSKPPSMLPVIDLKYFLWIYLFSTKGFLCPDHLIYHPRSKFGSKLKSPSVTTGDWNLRSIYLYSGTIPIRSLKRLIEITVDIRDTIIWLYQISMSHISMTLLLNIPKNFKNMCQKLLLQNF